MKYPQLVSMPSAVSDWLQGQLEARGIDAVLYTRYVLSLLHSHPVDLIYQDDLELSHLKKEVGKSNGGRKRSRKSSSDWWRYAQADAEQIKRSAAVECLLSASDQNCEIESLVDELCEKLKEVESQSASPIPELAAELQSEVRKLTPQELAEKYYAAFPPLCHSNPGDSKAVSPIKSAASPTKKRSARKIGNRSIGYENKLHAKENYEIKARNQKKERLNCFGRNKGTSSRNITAFTNWDMANFNRRVGAPKTKSFPDMDQCLEDNQDIWENQSEVNMYNDLEGTLKGLLDSPTPTDENVMMANLASMMDSGKRIYVPYSTDINKSIWAADFNVARDNNINRAADPSKSTLDLEFSSISIDYPPKPLPDWLPANVPTNSNKMFDNNVCGMLFGEDYQSLPNNWQKPQLDKKEFSREINRPQNDKMYSRYDLSLMKINHDREMSAFARVPPRSDKEPKPTNPFNRNAARALNVRSARRSLTFDKDEDLLTSEKTHFKPINEKPDNSYSNYKDGATFNISNTLNKVEYKRSGSGTLWLENEQGQCTKYFEYKGEGMGSSSESGFVIKFKVNQNDKACQTEKLSLLDFETVKDDTEVEEDDFGFLSPEPFLRYCTCTFDKTTAWKTDNSMICPLHPDRPESSPNEILWKKYETKKCDKCNNSTPTCDWSKKGQKDSDWYNQGSRDIWSGEEVCRSCLISNGNDLPRPTASLQLREDIYQDGDQLLSDIRSYMIETPDNDSHLYEPLPVPPKERKRRHSFILQEIPGDWSFASRLEEDCLIQISTLPTLRSVTL
ncbi:uncharacterized protein isoform X2 [Leptinotarsa decemlineata]|uniref:uncharacterized protein isoform X2 n=1 Tax=Leptinotarsa decemlineata TaxID=7539 RepID=UPI003D30494F